MKSANRKGFTLIELLIVVALLGALAVGLIATVDPLEQIKKARDTTLRNITAEFYNANLRYFSSKGEFPWGASSTFSPTAVANMGGNVTTLINMGELKNKFMELAGTSNLAKIFVTSTAADHVAVCYEPESKSFQEDIATMFGKDGQAGSNCKSQQQSGGSDCHFCVQ